MRLVEEGVDEFPVTWAEFAEIMSRFGSRWPSNERILEIVEQVTGRSTASLRRDRMPMIVPGAA
jgi:hypothetical protein